MKRRFAIAIVATLALLWIAPFLIPLPGGADPATLADPDGSFVEVSGLRTYVRDLGPREGEPVVLIHGLFGSTFTWRHTLEALAARGYRAIAFDRPGAGLSAKPLDADYSQPAHADFTAALLEALGIEQAAIVGHSAGGNVAAHLALRHPARVSRLVLVDAAVVGQAGPPPFIGSILAFPPFTRWAQVGIRGLLTPERLADAVAAFYADPALMTPEVAAGYWRAFQTTDAEIGLIGLTRDSANNRLTNDQIGSIAVPVGLIWGERDTLTPLEQSARLQALLRGARLTVIAGAGHQPMEERPEDFNPALLALLSF